MRWLLATTSRLISPGCEPSSPSFLSRSTFLTEWIMRFYWTRRPMRIPNGEVLLTDGRLYARARCGNRISETPLGPAILPPEAEPTQAAFDDLEKQEEPGSTPALLSAVAGASPQPSPDTSGPPESTRTS